MNTWTPLFRSLVSSSIWTCADKETRLLWITMLALKDQDGFVKSTVPGLAKDAGLDIGEVEKGLKVLSSPDKYSSTKDYEGRRIKAMDGGWLVLNHLLYRDMINKEWRRQYKRQKQAEYRKNRKGPSSMEQINERLNKAPEGTDHFREDPVPYKA
jgi:hypothetical protein